jgi:hypothetical protein
MSREELLDVLQSAMTTESATAIAIQNMIGTFTWSGLSDELRQKVVDDLGRLSACSQSRARRLKDLIAKV